MPNALAVAGMVHLLDGRTDQARRMITDAMLLVPNSPPFVEAFQMVLAREQRDGAIDPA
jgi:hypothetical protein